jgi:putative ABC transport system permease protein
MIDIDKWQEIFSTLKKHKLRTALTAFGVFWGIFMLVVLLGASRGFRNGVESQFDVAKNAVFVWTQRTSIPYKGLSPGRFINLKNDDIQAIRQNIPEVEVIAPRNNLSGEFTVNRKNKNASFQVYGDYPDYLKVEPKKMVAGRFINHYDIVDKRKVAVIGTKITEELFETNEDPIGEYISIRGIFFKVVGTFESTQKGERAVGDQQTIFIPNTTMQQAFNQGNDISWFGLLPKEGIPSVVVETKVKELLMSRHNVAPDDFKAFGSNNVEKDFEQVQGLFMGMEGFSWLVSIGTIIAGIVGVGNIMLIIVKERTKEIGIRKALGAKPWSIISMILQESLFLTAISGYAGLVVGVALIEGISYALKEFNTESDFFARPEINFTVAISAIIVLIVAGTLAGLIPAIKAAKVNPVIALKDE